MSHDHDITNLDYIAIHDFDHHHLLLLHQNNNNNNGWPLGLHSFINYLNSNHQNHGHSHSHSRNHSNHTSPHMVRSLSTPSITSQSNSSDDLETQSSESFFPDKSITLGSLIGIQSRSQPHQSHGIVLQRADRARKRAGISNVGGGGGGEAAMSTNVIRGDRTCCSLLVCGSGVDRHKQVGMSPSLAHLLEKERKSNALPSLVHFLERRNKVRPWIGPKRGTLVVEQAMVSGSPIFDNNDRVLSSPKPSGTPLKLFLERSSPNSYISSDWSAFIERGEAMSQHEHCPQEATLSHGKWLSLCFKKDSTRMAG